MSLMHDLSIGDFSTVGSLAQCTSWSRFFVKIHIRDSYQKCALCVNIKEERGILIQTNPGFYIALVVI